MFDLKLYTRQYDNITLLECDTHLFDGFTQDFGKLCGFLLCFPGCHVHAVRSAIPVPVD